MSSEQTEAPRPANSTWIIFICVSAYLVANFLYRLVVPSHEYPMRDAQVLDIALDVLAVVALLGMKRRVPTAEMQILFWIALAAAIGSFAIRLLNGDDGWWTGHLVYTLPRR
jgi:Na+/citrate or Na+/malate symporter